VRRRGKVLPGSVEGALASAGAALGVSSARPPTKAPLPPAPAVSASHDQTLRVWDTSAGGSFTCKRTLTGHEHSVTGVTVFASRAASLDPASAVQCVASASRDGTARLWDCESGASKGVLHGHDGWVRRVCAARGVEDVVATCGDDRVSDASRPARMPAASRRY